MVHISIMGGRGYPESDRGGEKKKDRGILGVGCCVFQAFFVVISFTMEHPWQDCAKWC